jgi:hypothetical protein
MALWSRGLISGDHRVLDEHAEAPVNRLEIDHEATLIVSNLIEFR